MYDFTCLLSSGSFGAIIDDLISYCL